MKKKLKSSALKEDKPENSIFFIQDNPNYKGLFSYSKTSRFNYLDHDPLYKFPTCNNQRIPKKLQINECLNPASINTPKFYNFLQEKSPFSNSKFIKFNKSIVSDSQDEGVPKNSINNISLNSEYVLSNNTSFNLLEEMERNKLLLSSSYISSVQNTSSLPEKAELSINTREQIMNIHRNFTSQQENELLLNSLTPASSINESYMQNSMISGQELCSSQNFDLSAIENDNKRLYNSIYQHEGSEEINKKSEENYRINNYFIKIYTESEEALNKDIRKSCESFDISLPEIKPINQDIKITEDGILSSSDDEGPLGISTGRLFLNGETASKAKLAGPECNPRIIKQLSNKVLEETSSQRLSTVPETQPSIDFSDAYSPIIKKLMFFESNGDHVEILSAIACSGFGGVLAIEYSSIENENRIFSREHDIANSL